jgi:hypothetical protein
MSYSGIILFPGHHTGTKYHYGDEIKEDEMIGACSMHGRDEKYNISDGKHDGKRPHGRR